MTVKTSLVNKFVATTQTRRVCDVFDGEGPGASAMSVRVQSNKRIMLVIGARYENRSCASFSKDGLADLIDILQSIHDAEWA